MKNKKLKVSPAKRVYRPKYPSFEDKNPLLYPDSKPYPFTSKFIHWASTGGIASLLLLGHGHAVGQAQKDSLYNPFPLENAMLPYRPVSFGTGMPERVSSDVAIQAIQNAFKKEGLNIDKNTIYNDGLVRMKLDGYDTQEEIGFVLLSYNRMDRSYVDDAGDLYRKNYNSITEKEIEEYRASYAIAANDEFNRFLLNKKDYIKKQLKYDKSNTQKAWTKALQLMDNRKDNQQVFITEYYNYLLKKQLDSVSNIDSFITQMAEMIIRRDLNITDKIYLIRRLQYTTRDRYKPSLSIPIQDKILKLDKLKSNKEFIKKMLQIYSLIFYFKGSNDATNSESYKAIKQYIMEQYDIEDWWKNKMKLDEYTDNVSISYPELKYLDEQNKNGESFIATISMRDDIMIKHNNYPYLSPELKEESKNMHNQYNEENGMTPQILQNRKDELDEINKNYQYNNKTAREKRDSINKIRREEREKVIAKYEAMEKLNEEEKAAWKEKFNAFNVKSEKLRKERKEQEDLKKLQKLEDEVRIYIKWAKSQLGN